MDKDLKKKLVGMVIASIGLVGGCGGSAPGAAEGAGAEHGGGESG